MNEAAVKILRGQAKAFAEGARQQRAKEVAARQTAEEYEREHANLDLAITTLERARG